MQAFVICVAASAALVGCVVSVGNRFAPAPGSPDDAGASEARAPDGPPLAAALDDHSPDWMEAEKGFLENHVQLTFPDRFVKAGEAYFSPDDTQIIFQAIEVPPDGQAAEEFYAMFVADIVRDEKSRITGIDNIRRISPAGSANTCGWFHPTASGVVLFASTIVVPTESAPPGYQRSSGRYRWMFPPEMTIVRCSLEEADGTAASLTPLFEPRGSYTAEGSLTADGRHLIFCSLESGGGDLYTHDLRTGRFALVVPASGYDGGPFFSPEGRRICYRSDRQGNHLLQLFLADLAFNDAGEIVGIEREYQLTNNAHVNWCPFWHPSGRFLVYATSEIGHDNYEVFLVDADPGDLPGSTGTTRYGVGRRRVTHAAGSDVLPVFNSDGTKMMWTSRRGPAASVQLWVADFVMDLDDSNDADTPSYKRH